MPKNNLISKNNPITNYFQIEKSTEPIPVPHDTNKQNDFYEKCLLEKLSECDIVNCMEEKQRLQSYLTSQIDTLKQVNSNVERITRIISRKEGMVSDLETSIQKHQLGSHSTIAQTMTVTTITSSTATPVLNTISNTQPKSIDFFKDVLFSKFVKNFSTSELAELRSFESSKNNDSTFVLKIIRCLYKNELEKIESISVTGRSRKGDPKEKMSEQNLNIVKDMLTERLESLNLTSKENVGRIKLVNTHIKNAFMTIVHTKKGQKLDNEETLRKINDQFTSGT